MNRVVRISVLCSAAVLAGVLALQIDNSWRKKSPGAEASLGQFPHVAILRTSATNDQFCSGAIIGRRTILTAAHCVDGLEVSNFEVVVGTLLNNATSDERNVYKVAKVAIHPAYKNLANDIAVMHTAHDIRMSDDVKVVQLGSIRDQVGFKLYPTGWSHYKVK